MLILLVLVLIYHLLILIELIPYQIAWGAVSIGINVIIMTIILLKGEYIKTRISVRVINILLWILTVVFILNTVGNLISNNLLETIIFTPLTCISAILCYRMAVEK